MTKDEMRRILENYAVLLGDAPDQAGAFGAAVAKGWLDEDGAPTAEGKDVAKALGDQKDTRSVFRIG